jgi:hypothetical protein
MFFSKKKNNSMVKRHSGSFLALFFVSLLGVMLAVGPRSLSSTIEHSADRTYDDNGTFDLVLMSELGFTDSDIEVLRNTDYIEAVSYAPLSEDTTSQNTVSSDSSMSGSTYPELFVNITGAAEKTTMTEPYLNQVYGARDRISEEIAPAQTAARLQNMKKEIQDDIDRLSTDLDEAVVMEETLSENSANLDAEYEKAKESYVQEQEKINNAKQAMQNTARSAQSSVEGAKQNLTKVLNEVYHKSVVTAYDVKRAQGASNAAYGTEKAYHKQFTSQWSEIVNQESRLHEEEAALEEDKEKKAQEIEAEQAALLRKEEEIRQRITDLEEKMEVGAVRWTIADRSILDDYGQLAVLDSDIRERLIPIGLFICLLSAAVCIALTIMIIKKNKERIEAWKFGGLGNSIIRELFVRRIGLSTALGALLGSVIGAVAVPVIFSSVYADSFALTSVVYSPDIITALATPVLLVLIVVITANLTYHFVSHDRQLFAPVTDEEDEMTV